MQLLASSSWFDKATGLLSDSVIMLDKLATLEKSLIIHILSEVDNDLKAEINPKLAACYRL
jgi:hypothetical protein